MLIFPLNWQIVTALKMATPSFTAAHIEICLMPKKRENNLVTAEGKVSKDILISKVINGYIRLLLTATRLNTLRAVHEKR